MLGEKDEIKSLLSVNYRDATFQEISWNQEISDRNKELQEKWISVRLDKNNWSKKGEWFGEKENVSNSLIKDHKAIFSQVF